MARDESVDRTAPEILARPQISLVGDIDSNSVGRFLDQLRDAESSGGDIAVEVTTEGGDAEMARRIVLEIGLARPRLAGRLVFLGKTVVYSAGISIMSAFPIRDRWLAEDATLMIHGRKLEKTVELSGPIRASIPMIQALLSQCTAAVAHEEEGYARLIEGSDIGLEELRERALYNWYLGAENALERGLVAGIWRPGARGPAPG